MSASINHPTDRPNFSRVDVGALTIWFSYRTPIAFSLGYGPTVVRRNEWSATTGKHLNYINANKDERISGEDFVSQLNAAIAGLSAY